MRVTNETDLLHGTTVTSREPPTPEMVMVIRGTFGFSDDGAIVPLEGIPQLEQGFLCADTFGDGDDEMMGQLETATDFADFKPRGEVLVYGSCHLDKPRTACHVTVSVGSWSKTLVVTGDRQWDDNGQATAPLSFEEMPLGYTHAFGGLGHAVNTVGKGFVDGGKPLVLPNVELEKDLVTSQSSQPAPGGFGPINPNWPARASKRGTKYGVVYAKTRAPYYAEDFDWTFFMAAPSDQWVSRYFQGDEEITAVNLFRSHPALSTRLPGIRPRCFVLDVEDVFREVSLELDTVTFDADAERISMSWRGLDRVKERDLMDVAHVLIVQEDLADEPRPLDAYRQRMFEIKADPIGFSKALAEAKKGDEIADPDPITKLALDSDLPIPGEVAGQIKDAWRQIEDAPEIDTAELLQRLADGRKEAPPEPPATIPALAGGKVRLFLRPQWEANKQQLEALRARGGRGQASPEEIAAMEKRLDDPRLREVDPTVREATTEAPGPGADLSGQDLSHRDLRGVDLSGANLDGCVCIETNFEEVNLTDASLDGTMLFKANLARANLTRANLNECNAAFANFEEAILAGARLDDGYFASAKLTGANLEECTGKIVSFVEANLENARANGIQLERSSFEKAVIDGACFDGGKLDGSRFHGTQGSGTRFEGAQLFDVVFNEATLNGVTFKNAQLSRSVWLKTNLTNAELSSCTAHDARFSEAEVSGARFVGADLRCANFYRAKLDRVDFSRSNLFDADLTKATLDHTLFTDASLYEAKLLEATGPGCDFTGANLVRAIIEEQK